jgi:hypothetical protein
MSTSLTKREELTWTPDTADNTRVTARKLVELLHKPAEKKALSAEMRRLIVEAQHETPLHSDTDESHKQEPNCS